MNLRAFIACGLAFAAVSVVHGKQKKLEVPPVFQTAHSIYVESVDGDISRPGVSQNDREAIQQVRQLLMEWSRYTLAESRDQADLVIVIRKGRNVGDQDHLGLGMHPVVPEPPPVRPGERPPMGRPVDQSASVGTGGDTIASEDLLRVYTVNEKRKLKGPVWSREMDRGLDGPSVRLMQELEAAVEAAYPRAAAEANR